MNELEKHIEFAEKQLLVYKYHGHPDVLKMEALYNYLLSIKNTNNKIPDKSFTPNNNTVQNHTITTSEKKLENKATDGIQGPLFDTSEFIKKKSMYDWES